MENIKSIKWEDLKKANDLIQTINLKGKEYAEVKERVIAFRRVFPQGQIISKIDFSDNYAMCHVEVYDENGILLSTGHAREYLKREFAVEKAESSACGRAIGFLGLGINNSIASAEDMQSIDSSDIFDEVTPVDMEKLKKEFFIVFEGKQQADILNGLMVKKLDDINPHLLELLVEHGKKQTN